MDFEQVLAEKEFIITTELDPGKGIDVSQLEEKVKLLQAYVDGINLTDSCMARMKISPIAVSSYLKDKYATNWICHMTARDRNMIGLQSEILGAALLGINNFLFLTGDKPGYGDHPHSSGVFDCDGTSLIKMASALKRGFDQAGNPLNKAADRLTLGGVVNPGGDLRLELTKLKERIEAGANFIQTQPVYDPRLIEQFMQEARPIVARQGSKTRILISIMPLKSGQMARYLNANVPGISIPEKVVALVERAGSSAGLAIAKSFITEIKGLVDGLHIMPMGKAETVPFLLEQL